MKAHYAKTKSLCSGTNRAPSTYNAATKRYDWSPRDFDTPSWRCLDFEPRSKATRFQYQVSVDAKAQTFTAAAVGSVRDDATKQRYTLTGRVKAGRVILGEVDMLDDPQSESASQIRLAAEHTSQLVGQLLMNNIAETSMNVQSCRITKAGIDISVVNDTIYISFFDHCMIIV